MGAEFGARQTAFSTARMISMAIESARADLAKLHPLSREAAVLCEHIADAERRLDEAAKQVRTLFKLVKS